jgi:hypothetical protein
MFDHASFSQWYVNSEDVFLDSMQPISGSETEHLQSFQCAKKTGTLHSLKKNLFYSKGMLCPCWRACKHDLNSLASNIEAEDSSLLSVNGSMLCFFIFVIFNSVIFTL